MLPRMFGLAVWQINFWINVAIASTLPVGSLSAITIAFQIFTFPQAAIAQAIATAVFPTLASHAAKESRDELNETLTTALRLTLFLALPAMIGLILLGQPLIALLFQSGKFTEQSTSLVSWALTWYGVGLISHSVVEVITRVYYAMKDTRTPVAVGAAAMILNVILSLTLTRLFASWNVMPHGGLALANTLATTIEAIGLWVMLRKHNARVMFAPLFNSIWRSGVATAVMGLGVIGWGRAVTAPLWLLSLGGASVGAGIYFVIALIVRSPEIKLPKFSRSV
jgi:putative peptidoglycan lipid II flippase